MRHNEKFSFSGLCRKNNERFAACSFVFEQAVVQAWWDLLSALIPPKMLPPMDVTLPTDVTSVCVCLLVRTREVNLQVYLRCLSPKPQIWLSKFSQKIQKLENSSGEKAHNIEQILGSVGTAVPQGHVSLSVFCFLASIISHPNTNQLLHTFYSTEHFVAIHEWHLLPLT